MDSRDCPGASVAVDQSDLPVVTYWAEEAVHFVRWNGTIWDRYVIEETEATYAWTELSMDSNNIPHCVYNDGTTGTLKYAVYSEGEWEIQEIADTDIGGSEFILSMALNAQAHPVVAFLHRQEGVKLAEYDGASWTVSLIDANGRNGVSLALDQRDSPKVSYIRSGEGTNPAPYFAERTDSGWDIVRMCRYGSWNSVAFTRSDHVRVAGNYSYWAENEGFIGVAYIKKRGGGWNCDEKIFEEKSSSLLGGIFLKFDSLNRPHVIFSKHNSSTNKYTIYHATKIWD